MYAYSNELAHYGIKGMRWGVRRYQNEDGSLTALGRKRQKLDDAKRKLKSLPMSDKRKRDLEFARNEYNDQKILDKLAKQKKKSKRQEALEKRYKEQGFSDKDAAIQAYKRARTERVLAIAGGMTVAALTAYAVSNHLDEVTDKYLKPGEKLGRISSNKNDGVKDAFYAFANPHDDARYTALYGNDVANRTGKAYRKNISIGPSGLKVASRDSAKNVLSGLVKRDSSYKNDVVYMLDSYGPYTGNAKIQSVFKRASKDLKENRGVTNDVYDAVNYMLVIHTKKGNDASRKFYDALKSKGYSAIRDMNDSRYSGYRTWNPLIVFDSSKVKVDSATELGQSFLSSAFIKELPIIGLEGSAEIAKDNLPITIPALALPAAMFASKKFKENQYVRDYYKQHPGSKLSKNELIRQYRKETSGF